MSINVEDAYRLFREVIVYLVENSKLPEEDSPFMAMALINAYNGAVLRNGIFIVRWVWCPGVHGWLQFMYPIVYGSSISNFLGCIGIMEQL